MRRHVIGLLALLASGLLSVSLSYSPATGVHGVAPAAAANAFINVIDVAMTLTPTAADYSNDYVEITGASGLRVEVKSNNPTGLVLYVRCADAAPQVRLSDFLVRTLTAPGVGGTTMSTYTAITAADQALWSTGVAMGPFQQVNIDIRIQNLFGYGDAPGGATTGYTDNLTFTVLTQ
jgi:hypothetical protein